MREFMNKVELYLDDTPRCLFLIALIAVIIYINSLGNSFVWHDKFFIIQKNGVVESLKEIPRIFIHGITSLKSHSSLSKSDIYYRPIITLSYSLDYRLWGLRPAGYHITNIIFHIANGFLIFFIFNLICGRKIIAVLTSLFFITHPVHTASVTYISNRLDIICLSFMLISWYCFIRGLDATASRKARILWFVGVNTAFMLALFSKETALVLPLLLLLHIVCFVRNKTRSLYKSLFLYLPSLAMVLGFYLALRTIAIGGLGPTKAFWQGNIATLIFTMSNIFTDYIRLLLWPFGLSTSDTARIYSSILNVRTIASLAVLSSLFLAAFAVYKRSRETTFAIFWFFITLLPVSNIVPILYLRADHFLYIPSLGFSLLTAVAIMKISGFRGSTSHKTASFILAALILLAYSAIVVERNRDWKDEITLFSRTVQTDPYCREAHACLGFAYDEMGSPERAFTEYRKALGSNSVYHGALRPARVLGNMAIFYYDKGLYNQSEACFKEAVSYEPEDANMHLGLGSAYFKKAEYAEAAGEFRLSLLIDPGMINARYNLGLAYLKDGRYAEAVKEYEQILKLFPDDAEAHYNLGLIHEKMQ